MSKQETKAPDLIPKEEIKDDEATENLKNHYDGDLEAVKAGLGLENEASAEELKQKMDQELKDSIAGGTQKVEEVKNTEGVEEQDVLDAEGIITSSEMESRRLREEIAEKEQELEAKKKQLEELEGGLEAPEKEFSEDELMDIEGKAREEAHGDKKKPEQIEKEKEEFPKIKLPDDPKLVESLKNKLDNYRQRLSEQEKKISPDNAPEQRFHDLADTNYKIAVLEKVLSEGEVDVSELSRELNTQDGEFDSRVFDNACEVINDYCSTGGKNVIGGDGFNGTAPDAGGSEKMIPVGTSDSAEGGPDDTAPDADNDAETPGDGATPPGGGEGGPDDGKPDGGDDPDIPGNGPQTPGAAVGKEPVKPISDEIGPDEGTPDDSDDSDTPGGGPKPDGGGASESEGTGADATNSDTDGASDTPEGGPTSPVSGEGGTDSSPEGGADATTPDAEGDAETPPEGASAPGSAEGGPDETTPDPDKANDTPETGAEGKLDLPEKVTDGFSKFNVSLDALKEQDPETYEKMKNLSEGQQLLLLNNLKQITLGRIRDEARHDYGKEMSGSNFLGKIWKGISKYYQIAKIEKENAKDIMEGGLEVHKDVIKQLTNGMEAYGPEVEVKNGQLEVQFATESENMTEKETNLTKRLNLAANKFSQMPDEWSYKSASRKQREQYNEAKINYEYVRNQLLGERKNRTSLPEAIQHYNDIDFKVKMSQFLNAHPEVEDALHKIQDQWAIRRSIKDIATERGFYMGLGFATRSISVSIMGAMAAPLAAAGMGAFAARLRTKAALMEQEGLARKGNEQYTYEHRLNLDAGEGGQGEGADKNRAKYKDYADAEYLHESLDFLVNNLKDPDQIKNSNARKELALNLHHELREVEQKLADGTINYGELENSVTQNLEGKTIERKGRLANQYALMQKYAEARAFMENELSAGTVSLDDLGEEKINIDEVKSDYTDHRETRNGMGTKYKKGLDQFLEEQGENMTAEQKKYIRKQMVRGAVYGAGFALGGWLAREVFHYFHPGAPDAPGLTPKTDGSDVAGAKMSDQAGSAHSEAPLTDTAPASAPENGHDSGSDVWQGKKVGHDGHVVHEQAVQADTSGVDAGTQESVPGISQEMQKLITQTKGMGYREFQRFCAKHDLKLDFRGDKVHNVIDPESGKVIGSYNSGTKEVTLPETKPEMYPTHPDHNGVINERGSAMPEAGKTAEPAAGAESVLNAKGPVTADVTANTKEMTVIGIQEYCRDHGWNLKMVENGQNKILDASGKQIGTYVRNEGIAPFEGTSNAAETATAVAEAAKTETAPAAPSAPAFEEHLEYQGGKHVWGEASKQLEGRFKETFNNLGGSDSHAAEALKTYNIDQLKDTIAEAIKNHDVNLMDKYGLKGITDIDNLSKEQLENINWDDVFKDTFGEKGLTSGLSPEKLNSIFEHNAALKDYFDNHPDVPRTSENYDAILRGQDPSAPTVAVDSGGEPSAGSGGELSADSGPKPPANLPVEEQAGPPPMSAKEKLLNAMANKNLYEKVARLYDHWGPGNQIEEWTDHFKDWPAKKIFEGDFGKAQGSGMDLAELNNREQLLEYMNAAKETIGEPGNRSVSEYLLDYEKTLAAHEAGVDTPSPTGAEEGLMGDSGVKTAAPAAKAPAAPVVEQATGGTETVSEIIHGGESTPDEVVGGVDLIPKDILSKYQEIFELSAEAASKVEHLETFIIRSGMTLDKLADNFIRYYEHLTNSNLSIEEEFEIRNNFGALKSHGAGYEAAKMAMASKFNIEISDMPG